MHLKLLIALVSTVFFCGPPVQGASLKFSPDLSGTYRGQFSQTRAGIALAGSNLHVVATVPANGRDLRLAIDGFAGINQGGVILNLACLGTLKITSHRKVVADNALLAYYVQLPATGRAAGKRALTYSLLYNDAFLGSVAMTYTLRIQGKRILISGSGFVNGDLVTIAFTAKKRGR